VEAGLEPSQLRTLGEWVDHVLDGTAIERSRLSQSADPGSQPGIEHDPARCRVAGCRCDATPESVGTRSWGARGEGGRTACSCRSGDPPDPAPMPPSHPRASARRGSSWRSPCGVNRRFAPSPPGPTPPAASAIRPASVGRPQREVKRRQRAPAAPSRRAAEACCGSSVTLLSGPTAACA
jgi:hypothetical protein